MARPDRTRRGLIGGLGAGRVAAALGVLARVLGGRPARPSTSAGAVGDVETDTDRVRNALPYPLYDVNDVCCEPEIAAPERPTPDNEV